MYYSKYGPHLWSMHPTQCRCERFAGLSHVSPMLVGAAAKHALAWTATVFSAETLAVRVGGTSRYGARLLPSATVFVCCNGKIQDVRWWCVHRTCKLAGSLFVVLSADTTCYFTSDAAFLFASAPSSGYDSSGADRAVVEREQNLWRHVCCTVLVLQRWCCRL